MEGARLGRYRLVRRVGAGGMAEVWEARMEGPSGFAKRVAIKRILPHLFEDEDLVTMFRDEARLASRLSHAHVAQVFDFVETGEAPFLVMEWVHGRDLRRVLRALGDRGEVLGPARTAAVGRAVAAALAHAHGLKDEDGSPLEVVHRDVSPQNVLVSFSGEVKLADFGIAKAARRSSHTGAGIIKGKAAYMSPEQARGARVDGRSDLFSLGVVLWECLCGRPLFRGDSDLAVMRAIVQGSEAPPPPSARRAGIPPSLDGVVARCLQRDPDARFGSARELEHALGDVLLEIGAASRDVDLAPLLRRLFPEEAAGRRRQTARLAAGPAARQTDAEIEIDVEVPAAASTGDPRAPEALRPHGAEGVGAPGPREAPTASLSALRAGRWGTRTWTVIPAAALLVGAAFGGWALWPGPGASGRPAEVEAAVEATAVEAAGGGAPDRESAEDARPQGAPDRGTPDRGSAEDARPQGGGTHLPPGVLDTEGSTAREGPAAPAGELPGATGDAQAQPPPSRDTPSRETEPRPARSASSTRPRPERRREAPRPAVPTGAGAVGGVGSIAALPPTAASSGATMPAGVVLRIRLLAPASDGGAVEAVLVRSVFRHGRVLLPRGTRVTGSARAREGRLLVTLGAAQPPGGAPLGLEARVVAADGQSGVALDPVRATGAAAVASIPEGTELVAVVQ